MAESYLLGTTAQVVGADSDNRKSIYNQSGDTVYYKNDSGVSSVSNDGSLAPGSSVIVEETNWVISAGQSTILVSEVPNEATYQKRTIDISSAEILDIEDTPIELVPAPGPNKVIVHSALFFFLDAGTAYSGSHEFVPFYDGLDPGSFEGVSIALTGTTDLAYAWPLNIGDVSGLHRDECEDKALMLGVNTSEVTDGTGTLKVTVTYSIAELP